MSEDLVVLSWDVGIAHLAYCVIEEKREKGQRKSTKILMWDNIDLIDDERNDLECSGKMKSGLVCGKKAKYRIEDFDGNYHGFCQGHRDQHLDIIKDRRIDDLYEEIEGDEKCLHVKTTKECCGKKARYAHCDDMTFCTAHHKSALKKLQKRYSLQLIKKITTANFSTAELQLKIINKLDKLIPLFSSLKINDIVIENQPAYKNPRMKSIASTLFDFFLIRAYVDRTNNWPIRTVRYMSPCNKLKVDNDNTLKVLKKTTKDKKYSMTKGLGIIYAKRLIKQDDDEECIDYLETFTKKDDLCDAYLQGRYYLEYYQKRNKPTIEQRHDTKPQAQKTVRKGGEKTCSTRQKNKDVVKSKNNRRVVKVVRI